MQERQRDGRRHVATRCRDSLHRVRHAEPDRVRGHLSAAGGGARPLPASRCILGYPDANETERESCDRVLGGLRGGRARQLRHRPACSTRRGSRQLREAVRRVRVEPTSYGVHHGASCAPPASAPALTLGASPRASVALLKLAQAAALLDGRAYVDARRREGARPGGAPAPGGGGAGARARGGHRRRRARRASSTRSKLRGDVRPVPPLVHGVAVGLAAARAAGARVAPAAPRWCCSRRSALWVVAFLVDAWRRRAAATARVPVRAGAPVALLGGTAAAGALSLAATIAPPATLLVRESSPRLLETLGGARRAALELRRRRSAGRRATLSRRCAEARPAGGRLPSGCWGRLGLAWRQEQARPAVGGHGVSRACLGAALRALPAAGAAPPRGGVPQDPAPRRRPALREPPRVGAGRRAAHHRLEGDGPARQADRPAVRGRAPPAGADRARRRPPAHGGDARACPARGGDRRGPAPGAQRGRARRQRRPPGLRRHGAALRRRRRGDAARSARCSTRWPVPRAAGRVGLSGGLPSISRPATGSAR